MSWQPNQAGVQQIIGLLAELQRPGADHHKVSCCRFYCQFDYPYPSSPLTFYSPPSIAGLSTA